MRRPEELGAKLATLLSKAGYQIDVSLQAQYTTYLQLLIKWNRIYNLTAIRDPQEMLVYHILDSLTVLPYLQGTRILDVGTGAGLPGIPLALMQQEKQFFLLDSNHKKTAFLTHVKHVLCLNHVHILNLRVEKLISVDPFDVILSRAFSSLANFLNQTQHLSHKHTLWLAMKGHYPHAELTKLPEGFSITAIDPVFLPSLLEIQRHIVNITRSH